MNRLIDLSHIIEDGLITYKGLPAPLICDFLSREQSRQHYAEGTEFHIGRIDMVANTGTYLDAPFHRYADGADIADLDLSQLAGLPGVLVSVPTAGRAVDESCFAGLDLRGKAVLVHTGWARHWKTDQYFEDHVFLTGGAAAFLRDAGAALVGIDSYNIDDTADMARPVHSTLLAAGVLIVEHMRGLELIPAGQPFTFYAVPVKVRGMGTFPVRAFVELEA